jgi:hypothetical protein
MGCLDRDRVAGLTVDRAVDRAHAAGTEYANERVAFTFAEGAPQEFVATVPLDDVRGHPSAPVRRAYVPGLGVGGRRRATQRTHNA